MGLSLLWIPFTRGSVHAQMDTAAVKGKWHPTTNMTSARVEHTATLLKNGDVLVEGDANTSGSVPPAAELYHPKTATWSLTGQMRGFHVIDHVAVLLGDGTVLVTGGMGFSGIDTTALSELFHPTTGTWSVT